MFIVVGIFVFCASLWMLSDVLLLLFGAILVAITLTVLAAPFVRLGFWPSIAVISAASIIFVIVALIAFLFGSDLVNEARALYVRFNAASENVASQLQIESIGSLIQSVSNGGNISNLVTRFLSWGMSLGQALFSLLLILVGGLYIALDTDLYKNGFLKLIPSSYQDNARATLDDIESALRAWVGGQFMAMILMGLLTGVGLSLTGIQSALALGVLAGLANMVPYLGSVLAAVVTLVVASAQGWEYVGWAAGVMFAVQQIESNVITPLVVGRAVSIPPATGMFAIIAIGVLFGPLGILLGFPLAVATDVAIRRLYVRDTLDEDVNILGQAAQRSEDVKA